MGVLILALTTLPGQQEFREKRQMVRAQVSLEGVDT
jgi:hypothetical protein